MIVLIIFLIVIFTHPTLGAEYREGEVILKVKIGSEILRYTTDARVLSKFDDFKYLHIVDKTKTTKELIEQFKDKNGVVKVYPNYIVKIFQTPNDTKYSQQWAMTKISAPQAWDVSTGSSSVVVAVIDTGVDYNHEDIKPNMWENPNEIPNNGIDDDNNGYIDDIYGVDVVNNDGDPMDDSGHGTHVAGIIGAVGNNGLGIAGVNWSVKIMAIKALDAGGAGDIAYIIDALNYVLDMKRKGVNIVAVNASYGCEGCPPMPDKDLISALGKEGIIFVTAAGNSGNNNDQTPTYPASYNLDNIISVAAVDKNDNLANFSNYGSTSVDIAAPGVDIISLYPRSCDYIPSVGDIFFDDMESGQDKWMTGGNPNNWTIINDSTKNSQVWDDSPSGNYASNSNTWLAVANPIDLSTAIGDICLGFESKFVTEAFFDFIKIEFSKDSGNTWESIAGLTGLTSAYTYFGFPIDSRFRTDSFKFRFRLISDDSVNGDGVKIDNVGVGHGTISHNYKTISGTSMATPFVTGTVALLANLYPSEDINKRILRIIYNSDPIPALKDKVLSGGRLNIYKALIQQISAPNIVLSTDSIFFGYGEIGSTKSSNIVISNLGYDLKIKDIYISGTDTQDFSFYNSCGDVVKYGQSCSVIVYFIPKSTGVREAVLVIENNDINSPKVTISLKGIGEKTTKSGGCSTNISSSYLAMLFLQLIRIVLRSYNKKIS